MSLAICADFEAMRSLGFAGITSTYAAVGTPLVHAARAVYIYNNLDKEVFLSFNGISDHMFLPAMGYWFFDIASNKTIAQGFFLAEGKTLYVRTDVGIIPTSGSVHFTVIYSREL